MADRAIMEHTFPARTTLQEDSPVPSPQPVPTGLPAHLTTAARHAAQILTDALTPDMRVEAPPADVLALWKVAQLLHAVAGDLDAGLPVDERVRARWDEAAAQAAGVVDQALAVSVAGLDLDQTRDRLMDAEADGYESGDALGYSGVVELVPPDFDLTERRLMVSIHADQHRRTLEVTADRGPAPVPRAHTPATLTRTAHHLHQLAKVLGDVVLEPVTDGIPLCGSADEPVPCQICHRVVGADTARAVRTTSGPDLVRVCSLTCARAAAAGEHTG